MTEPPRARTIALGLLGAAVGGYLGFVAFFWMARHGFYALALPPSLMGFAAGFCARGRSTPLAVLCGIAGLALGLFTEWRFEPFIADGSLPYFLAHVHTLKTVTLLMLALGTYLSYRFALGRDPDPGSRTG